MGNRLREDTLDPAAQLAATRAGVYDGLSRLVQDIGGANPATQITRYEYDAQGNLTRITDPLNHEIIQAFDALNRLVRMTDRGWGRPRVPMMG
jgi:YD repeat-containing protein